MPNPSTSVDFAELLIGVNLVDVAEGALPHDDVIAAVSDYAGHAIPETLLGGIVRCELARQVLRQHGPAWYLSTSLFLYSCFPFIAAKLERHRSDTIVRVIPVAIWLAQLSIAWFVRDIHEVHAISNDYQKYITYFFPIYRLGDYTIGCYLGRLFLDRKRGDATSDKASKYILVASAEYVAVLFFALCIIIRLKGGWLPML